MLCKAIARPTADTSAVMQAAASRSLPLTALETLKLSAPPITTQVTPALDYSQTLILATQAQLQDSLAAVSVANELLQLLTCTNATAQQELSLLTGRAAVLSSLEDWLRSAPGQQYGALLQAGGWHSRQQCKGTVQTASSVRQIALPHGAAVLDGRIGV